ncbi:MAG: winged helix-turn-helix transcriptional regulator [Burkholderiales bacterium]|nr:winged helix-turn-helix transcriptional regulator [Burkholderiales bacterium]
MTHPTLPLERFLPYRLSRLDNEISQALERIYGPSFGLNIAQWRMLAAISHLQPTSATELIAYSAMDKVTVSRAVAELVDRALVSRETDDRDRRRARLSLTDDGTRVYEHIAPEAMAFEQALVKAFSRSELQAFNRGVDKLLDAIALIQRGSAGLLPQRRTKAAGTTAQTTAARRAPARAPR